MEWHRGKRDRDFRQLCAWPNTTLGSDADADKFRKFIMKEFQTRVVVVGTVWRTTEECDLMFLVHDGDIPKFAHRRFTHGFRWYEDVLGNGSTYPEEFMDAYPPVSSFRNI